MNDFYDRMAELYHLIFRDWAESIERQAAGSAGSQLIACVPRGFKQLFSVALCTRERALTRQSARL